MEKKDLAPELQELAKPEKYVPKIGDWVRITNSGCNWASAMGRHDGKIVQVTNVFECGDRIEFEDSGCWDYRFSHGHFKPIEQPKPFTPTVGHVYFMSDEDWCAADRVFLGKVGDMYIGCTLSDYKLLKDGESFHGIPYKNIKPSENRAIKVKEAIEKVTECFDKVGAHKESLLYKSIINNLNDV